MTGLLRVLVAILLSFTLAGCSGRVELLASVPEAMRRIIATVNERHGSIRGMVGDFGVADAEIAQLESMLLDG